MTQKQKITDYFATRFKDEVQSFICRTNGGQVSEHIDLLAENTMLELHAMLEDTDTAEQLLARAMRLEADGLETFKLTIIDYFNGALTSLRDGTKDSVQEVAHGNGIG